MYNNIESMLLDQQAELYACIKRKSIDELNLPINVEDSIIAFGKILDFYMFWIVEKYGAIYFKARKEFTSARTNNLFQIEFSKENKNAILTAIDNIYNSYLRLRTDGTLENKITVRETTAKNKEKMTDTLLLWKNVTASVLERSERSRHNQGDIDTDTVRQLSTYGQRLAELFDEILHIMKSVFNSHLSRKISVYQEYTQSDTTTLADLAPKYNVSRERIRQLVKRVDVNISRYFKKLMVLDNIECNQRVEQVASVFEAADYTMTCLIEYGSAKLGDRKKRAIVNMLFGNTLSQRLMEEIQTLTERIQEKNKPIENEKNKLAAWDFYQSKIRYPSPLTVKSFTPIKSYQKEKSFQFEKRFYDKLKKFEPLIEIIENPDIVYCATSQTNHRPNFLLRLPDKSSVLVLVLPTINMAYIYNIQRCNELHRFCKEHGYGYLIIDDRENSIYDLKKRAIDPQLVDYLNTILNDQNMIVWQNIKEIKLTRSVSNADIAAYVLQNKLHFTMKPFCIKRRENSHLN